MDFKIGYNVKPKEINAQNQVIYEKWATSGESRLIDTPPNEDECKAYGFIWTADNRCFCYPRTTMDMPSMTSNISNTAGARNDSQRFSSELSFVGIDNLVMNECYNDLVVGNKHNIDRLVDNTIISGTKAYATANNSIVQGGNKPTARGVASENTAELQNTVLMYGVTTYDDVSKPSYLNNTNGDYFNIPINTIMYFEADILAVRVGGTGAGALGDYASWVERGVIINKNAVISVSTTNTPVVSSGTTTGWMPTSSIDSRGSELIINGNFLTATNLNGWVAPTQKSPIQTLTKTGLYMYSGDRVDNTNQMSRSDSAAMGGILGRTYEVNIKALDFIGSNTGYIRLDGVYDRNNIIRFTAASSTFTFVAYRNFSQINFFAGGYGKSYIIESISIKEVLAPPAGTNYNISVIGARDTNIEWASTIRFTEIRTNVDLTPR